MKLHPHPFALASSMTTAIMYIIAGMIIKFFPCGALQISAPLIQLNRFKLVKYLKPFFGFSPANFAIGVLELAAYAYLTSFLIAVLYNLFAGYYSKQTK